MKKDASIAFCSGRRGSGKTTRMIELLKGVDRAIVFDCMGDWHKQGFTAFKTREGMLRHIKANWNKGFRVSWDVHKMSKITLPQVLSDFSKDLMVIQQPYYDERDNREITFVIDEARFSVPNRQPKMDHAVFFDLVAVGRHYGINMILATQRVAQVHTDVRGNCSEYYFMQVEDNNDMQRIKPLINKQFWPQLEALLPHEYIYRKSLNDVKKGKNTSSYVK